MQTEAGEDDIPETENPLKDGNSQHSTDSTDSDESEQEDSVHETLPGGRETGYGEGGSQDEVVGDTSVVGTED